jgi:hypothetical protein
MNKDSKDEAGYTPRAMNPRERCELCRYMVGTTGCRKVEGVISPAGWCKHFKRDK